MGHRANSNSYERTLELIEREYSRKKYILYSKKENDAICFSNGSEIRFVREQVVKAKSSKGLIKFWMFDKIFVDEYAYSGLDISQLKQHIHKIVCITTPRSLDREPIVWNTVPGYNNELKWRYTRSTDFLTC